MSLFSLIILAVHEVFWETEKCHHEEFEDVDILD
jgi:hypothetical protein